MPKGSEKAGLKIFPRKNFLMVYPLGIWTRILVVRGPTRYQLSHEGKGSPGKKIKVVIDLDWEVQRLHFNMAQSTTNYGKPKNWCKWKKISHEK